MGKPLACVLGRPVSLFPPRRLPAFPAPTPRVSRLRAREARQHPVTVGRSERCGLIDCRPTRGFETDADANVSFSFALAYDGKRGNAFAERAFASRRKAR